ncbi:(+)-neomenthol dehydrogenase-like [Phoenix dactylifera]|uniref:(+)-neomenthol dehydrogenase-like n=1 Tax=Phoenix dactylifera TaxID=42345 RepID=A0A8B8ZVA4_PHODC|nr:(+)-neomenthol dehydrogenase-like [Phoenix dactylifera]XP_038978216.1 (+)-neomenthol dehydrogenase-like [Phoenix dactylifera]
MNFQAKLGTFLDLLWNLIGVKPKNNSFAMEKALGRGTPKRIAVVTGANKGIGLEICRQLSSNGVQVLLTARDEERGTAAVEKLRASGASDVVFHQLDVTDSVNASSLADFVRNQFGRLDILVNNAGILGTESDSQRRGGGSSFFMSRETYKKAEECLNTNYYGAKKVTEALLPLLQLSQSPRIVNVSSVYGKLQGIPNRSIQREIGDVNRLSEKKLDELVHSFLNDFKEGKLSKNGWPTSFAAYTVSKVALNAYTRILARRYHTICVNCVNPGYVKTDINGNSGILTVEQGAKGPVMLALLPDGSPSGLFYDQTRETSF